MSLKLRISYQSCFNNEINIQLSTIVGVFKCCLLVSAMHRNSFQYSFWGYLFTHFWISLCIKTKRKIIKDWQEFSLTIFFHYLISIHRFPSLSSECLVKTTPLTYHHPLSMPLPSHPNGPTQWKLYRWDICCTYYTLFSKGILWYLAPLNTYEKKKTWKDIDFMCDQTPGPRFEKRHIEKKKDSVADCKVMKNLVPMHFIYSWYTEHRQNDKSCVAPITIE